MSDRVRPGAPVRDLVRACVAEAARAPSVHNVQPARWRYDPASGTLALLRDRSRALPVADPSGHDVRVSLGAAWEGMALALGRRGWRLAEERWGEDARRAVQAAGDAGDAGAPLEVVAMARVTPGGTADPLGDAAATRRTWRGPLVADDAARGALRALADANPDARLLPVPPSDAAAWADAATWAFGRRPDHHAELWTWLRLDPRDPRYRRDGLTADALLLSAVERRLARVAMRPAVFRLLQRTGLGRPLLSEAAAVRSAAGVLCFCPPTALDDYTVGRRFYRLWLQAEALGLVLAPASAMADDAATNARLRLALALEPARRVANVFRAGGCPRPAPPASPRLPVEELLREG